MTYDKSFDVLGDIFLEHVVYAVGSVNQYEPDYFYCNRCGLAAFYDSDIEDSGPCNGPVDLIEPASEEDR